MSGENYELSVNRSPNISRAVLSRNRFISCTRHYFNIGIKHDFPFINIRKVPREVLKTEGKPEVFNISRGTLRMLMNDKIMFDRYYCINSKKTHRKLRKCLRTLFFSHTTIFLRAHAFYKYPRFGPWPGTFSHDDLKA